MQNYANISLLNSLTEYNIRMQSTRQRLLEYLEKQRAASAAELSRALQVTQADVRHHLGKLRKEGLVVRIDEGQNQAIAPPTSASPGKSVRTGSVGKRGRPAGRYSLSNRRLGDNLEALTGALLEQALEGLPTAERRPALQRLAARLAGGALPAGRLAQRLYVAIQRLNAMHYQARWEAHAEAPRVILGHCPYTAILPEHPELCALDAALLEALLDAPAEQVAKLARDGRGGRFCLFLVRGEQKMKG